MPLKPTFKDSLMFPSDYVAAEDLRGRDVNVVINDVELATLRTNDGKSKKFLIRFKGKDKPLVLNKTNARTIAGLHGTRAEDWVGKPITIYPTTCEAFGETTTCIRIRDRVPGAPQPEAVDLDELDGASDADAAEMADLLPDPPSNGGARSD